MGLDDDGLTSLLRRQAGVITRRQALHYLTPKALLHRTTSGRWRRIHRCVFVTHAGPMTDHQRLWLAVLALGDSACLSGLTALCAWGLRGIESRAIHVLIPHARRVTPPRGVHVHRTRVTPDLDGGRHLSPPSTMPARSLLDAAQWARSDQEARLIIASTFQQRLLTEVDVRREAEAMPNVKRRALLLRTAHLCAGGSHSLAELDLLALCRLFDLPAPTRQVARLDRTGRRRYMDAVFDPWRVAVEIDGAHHLEVGQLWDDAVKSNSLQLDGYVVLRYPAFALKTEAARIAEEIRQALRNAGWGEPGPP